MWLLDKLRGWRDWLFAQLAASAAAQVQTAFLEDAADCAIALEAKAKQLDELGLKSHAQELRRQLNGMLTATPTLPSAIPQSQDNGASDEASTAPRKQRRAITQEELFHAKRS